VQEKLAESTRPSVQVVHEEPAIQETREVNEPKTGTAHKLGGQMTHILGEENDKSTTSAREQKRN
jgi:hypothetical protein